MSIPNETTRLFKVVDDPTVVDLDLHLNVEDLHRLNDQYTDEHKKIIKLAAERVLNVHNFIFSLQEEEPLLQIHEMIQRIVREDQMQEINYFMLKMIENSLKQYDDPLYQRWQAILSCSKKRKYQLPAFDMILTLGKMMTSMEEADYLEFRRFIAGKLTRRVHPENIRSRCFLIKRLLEDEKIEIGKELHLMYNWLDETDCHKYRFHLKEYSNRHGFSIPKQASTSNNLRSFTKKVASVFWASKEPTKEPTKEQIQQDPDKEQQQLLQEKARLTQQLVDATTLLEQAEKDKSSLELEYYKKLEAQIADNKVYVTEILEKKQIITEDYEKLKLKVAEQLEEKEEQYLKEKQIIIDENQNLISEKDKVIAKLTSQVEEQLQIFADLKEKELYIAKLVKERQERVLKQPIKETSSIGLQFNYLIPSMDSLDSSVIIAGQKLFILQGDRSHSLQWEKYGFRLECPQGAVSKDTEVAVTALAGGNFKVPKGTMLVSAVYAISVSKGLLKPLVIELQHCVDLRKTSQTGCLKFVRAPLKSPNAYQFSIVEGGSFSVGNRYGSIERDEFCAFGIVHVGNGDTPNGGGNGSENDTQTQGTNNDWEKETNGDTPNDSSNGAGENSGGGGATPSTSTTPPHDSINDDPSQLVHEVESYTTDESTVQQSDHVPSDSDGPTATVSSEQCLARTDDESLQSPDHSTAHSDNNEHFRDTLYSGMMYYDKKETGHWKAMYSVVRDLEVLKTYLENKQTSVEYDNIADLFKFIQPNGTLKMTLQTTQLQLGWTVYPDRKPMELFQSTIDYFPLNPLYSSCSMSVYAKPGIAQDPLHCPIELTGIDPLKVVYINKSPPALPPSMSPTTSSSSSNVVHESASVSSTGGAIGPSATSDVTKVKKVIGDVLVSHYAALNSLKTSLSDLASQLYAAHLISDEVKETRSMENFITEFKASLNFKRKLPQVEEHCQKFLSSFIAVRGSYADAAIVLCEDWIEVIRNELGINFSINIDA